MYCKKCGNPIKETDITCKICGAPTSGVSPAEPAESEAALTEEAEEQGEKRPVHHTEFNWNVYDFPKPKKTEELKLEWSSPAEKKRWEEENPQTEPEMEISGQTTAETGKEGIIAAAGKSAAQTAGRQETPDQGMPRQETSQWSRFEGEASQVDKKSSRTEGNGAQVKSAIAVPAPEKKAEAEVVRAESVREIEKFFTFTKKNEEFQQLLDREYEKLKDRTEGEPYIEPHIEPDMDFTRPVLGDFAAPHLSDADSELERMILEGTTPVEEAAPVVDLLHRRTIPVDLARIQREAKKAEEARNREWSAREPGDEATAKAEAEIPSFAIPRKNLEDIGGIYGESAGAESERNETPQFGAEPEKNGAVQFEAEAGSNETLNQGAFPDTAGKTGAVAETVQSPVLDRGINVEAAGTAEAEKGSAVCAAYMGAAQAAGGSANTEPELSPDDELARQLSEMAAARESFLRQLAQEKEALRIAEEEAARRVKLQQELNEGARREPGRPASPETVLNQSVPAANAEIQVTVAVKAGGGVNPQETVSVISTPMAPVQTTYMPSAGGYQMETPAAPSVSHMRGANVQRPPHIIDAEAVEVTENVIRPDITGRRATAERLAQAEAARARVRAAAEEAVSKTAETRESGPQAAAGEAKEKPAANNPAASDELWHENTLNSLFAMEPQTEECEEENEEKGRGRIGKIILIIIAVILAVEIAALGIKFIAPDSAAAEAVRGMEVKIVELFNGAVDGAKDFFSELSGNEKDPVPGGEEDGDDSGEQKPEADGGQNGADQNGSGATEPDPAPMADKTALIATQAAKNKNIKEITASDELGYVSGKDYSSEDINNSKPIENNIWKTLPTGETLYYDQAVVGTLIAYDSQWQDYVNNETKDALSLLKEGSKAYRYATTFSGVGKETQSFESLQIGEIRRGDSGSFYIWTKEQIKKTKNGQTKTATYYWIYQMEAGEEGMKIVNYTKFR